MKQNPAEWARYQERLKRERDHLMFIEEAAENEKLALERGLERGRQEGQIQLLHRLLDRPEISGAELAAKTLVELQAIVAALQQELRSRGAKQNGES